MKADELIALAAAHGIDLVQAARLGGAPAPKHTVRMRSPFTGRSYDVLAGRSGHEAGGRGSPSFERPAWTLAELGQASQGVEPLHFMAACFAFAGDRSVYWKLWDAIDFTARRLRARNHWPAQVRGSDGGAAHFYLERLAQLVLDEDSNPDPFRAAPKLYAIYLDVDETVWNRQLFERFDAVKIRYLGWIDQALRIMRPRLDTTEA